jgi:type I restriction enzyme, S subunit
MHKLSQHIDPNKVFIINRSALEGRLQAEYYMPSIAKIENIIRAKSSKKLRDFAIKLASGSTPSVTEEEKFYSDKENGIPFLRVQNLQANGNIEIEDVKYINEETHLNYLKRSQVNEYDLLVKITGVGRMAIASVAPAGFVGNTNQHMAVIKTDNKKTSKYLANYLNLDIIEKIATRKATGGTRPALDYPALKSMPIIENIDFSIIEKAEKIKQQKEAQAKELLKSIDTYLLNELGISLSDKKETLKSRIFKSKFSEVVGLRLDPLYFNNSHKTESKKYSNMQLRKICNIQKGQSITKEKITEGDYPVIAGGQSSPYNHNIYNYDENIITVSASGAYAGYTWYHTYPIFASDCVVLFSNNEKEISTKYVALVLKTLQQEIYKMQQGAGQPHVYARDIEKFTIPVPSPKKQIEIVEHISNIQNQISQLQQDANAEVENAKAEVEKLILS